MGERGRADPGNEIHELLRNDADRDDAVGERPPGLQVDRCATASPDDRRMPRDRRAVEEVPIRSRHRGGERIDERPVPDHQTRPGCLRRSDSGRRRSDCQSGCCIHRTQLCTTVCFEQKHLHVSDLKIRTKTKDNYVGPPNAATKRAHRCRPLACSAATRKDRFAISDELAKKGRNRRALTFGADRSPLTPSDARRVEQRLQLWSFPLCLRARLL
jgi:hypothetical protein